MRVKLRARVRAKAMGLVRAATKVRGIVEHLIARVMRVRAELLVDQGHVRNRMVVAVGCDRHGISIATPQPIYGDGLALSCAERENPTITNTVWTCPTNRVSQPYP